MNDMITPTIPVPVRLARRPRDHRGFIIPFFVAWLADGKPANEGYGEPDFRVVDHRRIKLCVEKRCCWLCGERLGAHLAFVLGPMCTINRVISEPPSHLECAEYALKACPFLSRPRMRRNYKDLPPDHQDAAGDPQLRNPGTMVLWITRSYTPFNTRQGNAGVLFRVGAPEKASWWREGRLATHDEAAEALARGYDTLMEVAQQEGTAAVSDLNLKALAAGSTLPQP